MRCLETVQHQVLKQHRCLNFIFYFWNVSWKTITPVFFSGLAPHHLLSLQSHSASIQGQSMTSPRDEGLLLMQSTNQNVPEQPYHPGLKRGRWESGGSESPIESGKDRDAVHIISITLEFFSKDYCKTEPTYNHNINLKKCLDFQISVRTELRNKWCIWKLKCQIFLNRWFCVESF